MHILRQELSSSATAWMADRDVAIGEFFSPMRSLFSFADPDPIKCKVAILCGNHRAVFEDLPGPNRACMAVRCLRCYVRPPIFLIWNNLCDLVQQTPTKTGVSFR